MRLPLIRSCAWLALAFCIAGAACSKSATARSTAPPDSALDVYDFGGDFSLLDQTGRTFQLAQERGKVVLLFFGYTMCPDVCPTTLSKLTQVYRALGPAAQGVETLFVTVDPDRDTPAALQDYLKNFDIKVKGLTGTRSEIDAVTTKYRASYSIDSSDSAAGYLVSHTTLVYLIDQQGRLRHFFKHTDSPDAITAVVREALGASQAD